MNFLKHYNAIAYTSAFSVILPITISLYRVTAGNKVNKVLLVYLFLSLFVEMINFIFLSMGKSNIIVVEIFKLLELSIITYMFSLFNLKSRRSRFFTIIMLFVGLLLFLIDLKIGTTILFNGFAHCAILSLTFFAFYKMLLDEYNIADFHFFWISCGILFYFSISFFLFLLYDFTKSLSVPLAKNLWLINLATNMLYYLFLSIGIWKIKRR